MVFYHKRRKGRFLIAGPIARGFESHLRRGLFPYISNLYGWKLRRHASRREYNIRINKDFRCAETGLISNLYGWKVRRHASTREYNTRINKDFRCAETGLIHLRDVTRWNILNLFSGWTISKTKLEMTWIRCWGTEWRNKWGLGRGGIKFYWIRIVPRYMDIGLELDSSPCCRIQLLEICPESSFVCVLKLDAVSCAISPECQVSFCRKLFLDH
jgi:hypothetical protein